MVKEVGSKQPGHVQPKQPVDLNRKLSETADAVGAFSLPAIPAGAIRRTVRIAKDFSKRETAKKTASAARPVLNVSSKRTVR